MQSDVSRPSDEDIERLRQAQWSERDPDGRAFAAIAEAHRLRGELHLAKTVAQEGVGRLPDFVSGHVVVGLVHRALRSPVEADVAFRRVLDLDPENTVALRSLGQLAQERDSHAEAAEYFRQLQLLDPRASEAVGLDGNEAAGPENPEALELEAAETVGLDDGSPAEAPEERIEPGAPVPIADLAPEEGSFEFSVADLDDVFKVQGGEDLTETVAPVDLPDGDLHDHTSGPEEAAPSAAPEWSWSPAPEAETDLDPPGMPVGELAPETPAVSVGDQTPEEPSLSVADLAPDAATVPVDELAPEDPVVRIGDLAPAAEPDRDGSMSVTDLAPDASTDVDRSPEVTALPVDHLAPAQADPLGGEGVVAEGVAHESEAPAADPALPEESELHDMVEAAPAAEEERSPLEDADPGAPAEDDFQAWLERNSL
ncbi:MAG: hypothetical protein HKN73_20500 [Gemmatimonadetes bacterium]|nr:hypothetical protein [Gemmatimonadota bacterium]